MLKTLKEIFQNLQATGDPFPQDEQLLASAAAVLLLEVAWADHDMTDAEVALIEGSLQRLFDLPAQLTRWLVADARERQESSVGLYEYTRVINEALSAEDKYRLMVALWQLALSDDALHALEEHTIRRISELVYLPHGQFIRAKQEARGA